VRRLVLFLAALAVAAAGSLGPASAQHPSSDLFVSRGMVKYGWSSGDGGPRHSLKLKAMAVRPTVFEGLDKETVVDAILGGESIFGVAPGLEGARIRVNGKRRWVAKVRGPAGTTGSRRLKIDLRRGTLVLRVRRADLSALRAVGPSDLSFELFAGQRETAATVTFRIRAGANPVRWDLLRGGSGGGGDPGGGGGGGGDPGGGTDRELTLRTLASGMRTELVGQAQRVARTQAEWNLLWAQHAGIGKTPPTVDFSRDMVVGVFLGFTGMPTNPTTDTGIKVSCVKANSSRVLVSWERVPNVPYSACPPPGQRGPCVSASAFHFVAVERHTLNVQFSSEATGTGS